MTRKSFMSIKNMAFKKLAIACVAVVAMGATLQAEIERNKDKGWMLTSLKC